MTITDIHTHTPENRHNAVVSGSPAEVEQWISRWPGACFSTGIHPWQTQTLSETETQTALAHLQRVASLPQVAAIGETGLDRLRGGDDACQELMLRRHIELSESLGKPLVLHIVKSADRLLAIRKELSATLTQPWIWHGFRGKPRLADQFMSTATPRSAAMISLGERFNPDTAKYLPINVLLAETDESHLTATEIIRLIAEARGSTAECLEKAIAGNSLRTLSGSGTV